jgi:hypothetical protein
MVDLLVADIATAERGRADFPFLRNFDPYEGHSWASGIGLGATGNNQESSSEAINAWAGLILWGEVTGNTALRDLGVYLYTTEIEAINHYWFDLHGLVFAPEYKNVEVSMLFGGKYAHNTWWTDEPRQIKGINLLPMTTVSTYLGRDPNYMRRNLAALKEETKIYNSRQAAQPAAGHLAGHLRQVPGAGRPGRRAWPAGTAGAPWSWATPARTRCTPAEPAADGPARFQRHGRHAAVQRVQAADGKRTYLAFNADGKAGCGADQRAHSATA